MITHLQPDILECEVKWALESIEELMDARNTLEKPIVYERINSIKSKFYVEDGNTIYVYVMKDDGE